MCLIFLMIKTFILIMTGGQSLLKVPAESVFQDETEQEVLIRGQVYQKSNTAKVQILYLKNNSIHSENKSYHESQLLIYDDTFTEIPIGKQVTLKGTTSHFDTARNPGNFDQRSYYAKQGIYGIVWCENIVEVSGEANSLKESLYRLRLSWKEHIYHTMKEESAGILCAMLLGEKSMMDADVKELYQKTGIGHLLAISGLHVSFIGLGIYQLFRKRGCPYLMAGGVAITFISGYTIMIGFSVSVLRAYLMLLIKIGADITGRVYDMATSLMVSAVATVLWKPLCLTDSGFLMSYGAILGILLILPALQKIFPCKWKILSGLYTSLSVNIMLFPVLIYFYYEFPTYSVLLNMLVVPLMSFVLGLGMFGSILCCVWKPIGSLLLLGCHYLLRFIQYASEMMMRLPMSRVVLGQPAGWKMILYCFFVAVMLLIIWFGKGRKTIYRIRLFMIILLSSAFGLFFIEFGNHKKLQIAMLDVGQGDCIFIKGPTGNTYMLDGGSSDVEQVGKYRIEPFLKSEGVGQLDYVFVSHGDTDHYGGIMEMVTRQDVGVIIKKLVLPANYRQEEALVKMSTLAKQYGVPVAVMDAGASIQEENLKFTCIQPSTSQKQLDGNAGSMVLDIQYGRFDMLCTGDVEAEGEESLVRKLKGKQYDVLKVAHHGSKNSTSEEFLRGIKPKYALISCGEGNRYGHPHMEVIERLEEVECGILQTQKVGCIMMRIGQNSLTFLSLPFRL